MKLEIQSVMLKNFLSYGDREQVIPFHQGVNVVLGRDLSTGRSNGSGKSSFLESIPFALFGQTHKDIVKEQIINWKNRKKCEVVINFKKGDNEYKVLRSIKPDNLEIWENDSLIDRPSHVRDYQIQLEEIIGLNLNTFISLIHSNVNSSKPILSMKKGEKRKFMENVFGLELYSELNKKANDKIKNLKVKIDEIGFKEQQDQKTIENAKSRIDEVDKKIKSLGSYDSELKESKTLLNELLSEHGNIDEDISNIEDEEETLNNKIRKLNELSDKVSVKVSILKSWIKDIISKLDDSKNSDKARKAYLKYVKENGKPSEIVEKLNEYKTELAKYDSEYRVLDAKLKECDTNSAVKSESIKNEKRNIDNLVGNSECPTCGQSLKQGRKDILKKLKDNLSKLEEEKSLIDKECKKLKTEAENMSSTVDMYRYNVEQFSIKKDELYRLKDKIKSEYDVKDLNNKKLRYEKTLSKMKELLESVNYERSTHSNTLQIKKEKRNNLEKVLRKIENQKREIQLIEEKIKLQEKTRDEFRAIIATETENIKKCEKNIEIFEKKRKTFINIMDYMEIIKDMCKDENIKQFAISSIMPYLNKQTNHYLSEVGYGFYTLVDRWLEAEIKGPGISKASYGSLSGGEARGIDLAIQFGLLDIARIQAGVWPDMLILDELLDSSVDGLGIGKLMDIVRAKQMEERSKVFIISHREEVDSDFADHVYEVTKDDFSIVSIR